MNRLHFLTAGLPIASDGRGYKTGLNIIKEMNLDGVEVEFVHGVKMNEVNQQLVKDFSSKDLLYFSCACCALIFASASACAFRFVETHRTCQPLYVLLSGQYALWKMA